MTMRYGLIWLDGIGTLRHRGCRASASLPGFFCSIIISFACVVVGIQQKNEMELL